MRKIILAKTYFKVNGIKTTYFETEESCTCTYAHKYASFVVIYAHAYINMPTVYMYIYMHTRIYIIIFTYGTLTTTSCMYHILCDATQARTYKPTQILYRYMYVIMCIYPSKITYM